ncbi:hypothetical protein FPOAC2_10614 [Fusarium poae]|uniref:hypothetical protein n=1 Tax=Fusarium poae TaxID=36050 RepID=UPI001CE87EA1|nr:hypothetical protein FPOAC1_010337 [Fusarium poae]KAG8665540.1 hypothetical protein FPOAC1_010337 [Fusarium poae]
MASNGENSDDSKHLAKMTALKNTKATLEAKKSRLEAELEANEIALEAINTALETFVAVPPNETNDSGGSTATPNSVPVPPQTLGRTGQNSDSRDANTWAPGRGRGRDRRSPHRGGSGLGSYAGVSKSLKSQVASTVPNIGMAVHNNPDTNNRAMVNTFNPSGDQTNATSPHTDAGSAAALNNDSRHYKSVVDQVKAESQCDSVISIVQPVDDRTRCILKIQEMDRRVESAMKEVDRLRRKDDVAGSNRWNKPGRRRGRF